jgi:DNA transformation protein and related proteins
MDREFLIDLFAGFGPVTLRPMFSGFGISVDGVNFALALRSGLYLRADEQTFPEFEAAGSRPFQYETRARTVTIRSYWQVPAHLYDDTDEFAQWARAALAAAQRAALKKRAKTRKNKTSKNKTRKKTGKPAAPREAVATQPARNKAGAAKAAGGRSRATAKKASAKKKTSKARSASARHKSAKTRRTTGTPRGGKTR